MMKLLMLTICICFAALALSPSSARTSAKWRIMQGTGDYAHHGAPTPQPVTQKVTKNR
jgi:hypothetical protein